MGYADKKSRIIVENIYDLASRMGTELVAEFVENQEIQDVLEAIVTANERLRTTTLLITHNADIARIGDRVVRFADGLIRAVEVNPRRIPPSELHW